MSTKLFSLLLDCDRELDRPLASVPAAFLDALAPVFQPRTIWVLADDVHELQLERMGSECIGAQRLWLGEVVDAERALTYVSPPDAGLVAELKDALPVAARSLFLSASGALRFRAPDTAMPTWYGRWHQRQPACLLDLMTVRLEWTDVTRQVELSLAFSGYPLTSSELRRDGSVGGGDAQAAAANREQVFETLARLPRTIGVPAGSARWTDDGDYASLFPDDADDIRGRWLPWLNADS